MVRAWIILAMVTGLTGTATFAQIREREVGTIEPEIQKTEPPLIVFLIHGLGGGEDTFHDLAPLLQETFNREKEVIRVVTLVYQTKSHDKTVFHFTNDVHAQILKYFADHDLPSDHPYGFIMHSQGSLIGRAYIAHCLPAPKIGGRESAPSQWGRTRPQAMVKPIPLGELKCKPEETPDNFRLFATLGGPMYGSPYANKAQMSALMEKLSGAGEGQLQGLAIGSNLLHQEREDLISKSLEAPLRATLAPNATMISIIGVVSSKLANTMKNLERFFVGFVNDAFSREDDIVVPATYANPNFSYLIEGEGPFPPIKGRVNMIDKIFYVDEPHIPIGGLAGLTGMTRENHQRHLAYNILLREINAALFKQDAVAALADTAVADLKDRFVRRISIFSSELQIQLPTGYQRKPELLENDITITTGPKISEPALQDQKLSQAFGFLVVDDPDRRTIGFYHFGRFAPSFVFDPQVAQTPANEKVCYHIAIDGFLPKDVCVQVRVGEAHYARVNLKPYSPLPAQNEDTRGARSLDGREDRFIVGVVSQFERRPEQKERPVTSLFREQSGGLAEAPNVLSAYLMDLSQQPRLTMQSWPLDQAPASVAKLQSSCYVARMGLHDSLSGNKMDHTAGIYRGFADDKPFQAMNPGSLLQIRGRYRLTIDGKPVDRYLVTAALPAVAGEVLENMSRLPRRWAQVAGWVNRFDVDVLDGLACLP